MKFYINPIISIQSINIDTQKSIIIADKKFLQQFSNLEHDIDNKYFKHISDYKEHLVIVYDNRKQFLFIDNWWLTANRISYDFESLANSVQNYYERLIT